MYNIDSYFCQLMSQILYYYYLNWILLCECHISDNTMPLVGTGLTQFTYTVYPRYQGLMINEYFNEGAVHNILKLSIALKSCPTINNNCLSICTNICTEQKKEF